MPKPQLLYSVNTFIAFKISEMFYNNIHWVWTSPRFDSIDAGVISSTNPPSSNPFDIYQGLLADVNRRDRHSSKIKENKVGLLNGVTAKRSAGIINNSQKNEIMSIINSATPDVFYPLIYIIPFKPIKSLVKRVGIGSRAGIFSEEYIIEQLPRSKFEIISLERK